MSRSSDFNNPTCKRVFVRGHECACVPALPLHCSASKEQEGFRARGAAAEDSNVSLCPLSPSPERGSSNTGVLEIFEAVADRVWVPRVTPWAQHVQWGLQTAPAMAPRPQPSSMRLISFISSAVMGFRLNPFSSALPVRRCRKSGVCCKIN